MQRAKPISAPGRQQQLQRWIARLGLPQTAAVDWSLLNLALTHPTISATENYEQLEFVGDSVLRLCVSQWLWSQNAQGTVGQWTAIRSELVSDRTLAEIAETFGLAQFLRMAPSVACDRKGQQSLLADSLEAVIGALYLSQSDFSLIRPWLEPELQRRAQSIQMDPTYQNYKSALQELTQAHYRSLPDYRVVEQSANADQRFQAEVWVEGECSGVGMGASRKDAEKAAARVAYLALISDTGPGTGSESEH